VLHVSSPLLALSCPRCAYRLFDGAPDLSRRSPAALEADVFQALVSLKAWFDIGVEN
jgi:hypothetical protein